MFLKSSRSMNSTAQLSPPPRTPSRTLSSRCWKRRRLARPVRASYSAACSSSPCNRSRSDSASRSCTVSACASSAVLRDWRTISAVRASPVTASRAEPISTGGMVASMFPCRRARVAITIGTENAPNPTRKTRSQVIRRGGSVSGTAKVLMAGCRAAAPRAVIGITQKPSATLPQTYPPAEAVAAYQKSVTTLEASASVTITNGNSRGAPEVANRLRTTMSSRS